MFLYPTDVKPEPVVTKPAVIQTQTSTDTDISENEGSLSGRKPGLCLIIDKLKNIETKLDELKTIGESNCWFKFSPIEGDYIDFC